MPTPVGSARICVSGDAARALDEAVAVARRRAHAQTTSLHVVSALLSPSFHSPMLRDALARARSAAYSPRLQFKALELCFGVALDRLPSAHPPPAEPAVSNSLMAAIKRSQANQRRNPDTFHLYSGGAAGATTVAGVKVELQQMLMAILDDPVVSRVFGEAGFRSCDIKLAVLRPPPQILRFPRSARCPPLFLCNFDSPFPFPLSSDAGDENCRRIGETLTKSSCKNPILIGVGAAEAARDFARAIEQQNASIVPAELRGVKLVRIENWNSREVEEMGRGAGALVILGDLKGLVECSTMSGMVAEVTASLLAGEGRVWVMGWSATYEMYMKLLSKHPCLDKDWDLQLLPITSMKNGSGGSLTRPHSLMESFVPFGGFFPLACESKFTVSNTYQPMFIRCQLCNEMYEQDVAAITKGWSYTSAQDHRQEILPSWLRNTETDTSNKVLDFTKARDDKALLNAKVLDLQKKWNDNCKRLHCGSQMIETDSYQLFPHIVGLQYVPDKQKLEVDKKQSSNWANAFPVTEVLEAKNLLSELQVRPTSTSEQLQTDGFRSLPVLSDMNTPDDHASPSSVTSVTTDLVLGTPPEAEPASQAKSEVLQVDVLPRSIAEVRVQSYSSCCSSDSWLKCKKMSTGCLSPDSQSDFKAIFRGLVDKVGRQEEAISAISQAILRCRSGTERLRSASQKGDIWFSFHGPDKVGKRKVALALSELMFDSRENFISADLSFQDNIVGPNAICDIPESDVYYMNFRGKTLTDYIAAELSKKPWSVVFLENVDTADLLVQNALSQAIRTGKFSDSHGREFSINNAIFITTANTVHGKACANFSEETVLSARRCQMKISLDLLLADAPSTMPKANVLVISSQKESSAFITKRKLDAPDDIREHRANKTFKTFLDLNLPVEELSGTDSQCSSADENNSDSWVEEFFESMDERVNFKPFDFDALADDIIKEISYSFLRTTGPDYILEIDIKAMQQILAATWLLEERTALSNWIERTLCRSCDAARQCRPRNASSSSSSSVLRLVACEDELMEQQAPGILLPLRISLN